MLRLASALNRRDEVPNQELAMEIVANEDRSAVDELVKNLSNKSKDIQYDCIKVLYEVGGHTPALIADYAEQFTALVDHPDNRMQWGAMTVLNSIALQKPDTVYAAIPKLASIADRGSVITRDNFVSILIKLSGVSDYRADTLPLLNEQMLRCPSNQLPMYAENALVVIADDCRLTFIDTLNSRLKDLDKESKRKRIERVLKKLSV